MSLLEIRDLRVSFGSRTVADIPVLDVGVGQIVGVVGESGSGKSTTAWALLGLAQMSGATVTGSIRFVGRANWSGPGPATCANCGDDGSP